MQCIVTHTHNGKLQSQHCLQAHSAVPCNKDAKRGMLCMLGMLQGQRWVASDITLNVDCIMLSIKVPCIPNA